MLLDVYKSSEEEVGILPVTRHKNYSSDLAVSKMSQERKQLISNCNQTKAPKDRKMMKAKINQLKNKIRKRLKELDNQKADDLVKELNSTDDSHRFYKASKTLAVERDKKTLTVHNDEGNIVGTDELKGKIIMNYFKTQFNDENEDSLVCLPFLSLLPV